MKILFVYSVMIEVGIAINFDFKNETFSIAASLLRYESDDAITWRTCKPT